MRRACTKFGSGSRIEAADGTRFERWIAGPIRMGSQLNQEMGYLLYYKGNTGIPRSSGLLKVLRSRLDCLEWMLEDDEGGVGRFDNGA